MLAAPLLLSLLIAAPANLPPYSPAPAEVAANYQRADKWIEDVQSRTFVMQLTPVWLDGGKRFWYRVDRRDGSRDFVLVDSSTGEKKPAFDHAKLISEWRRSYPKASRLPFSTFTFKENGLLAFEAEGFNWEFDQQVGELKKRDARERTRPNQQPPWRQDVNPPDIRERVSPDGEWALQIRDMNVVLKKKGSEETTLTSDGVANSYYARVSWSPDSKHAVITRVNVGDRKEVHLIESSPADGGRAKLHSRIYDLPGDAVDTFATYLIDTAKQSISKADAETVDFWGLPAIRWAKDGSTFTYEKLDRGYGRWRIIQVDANSGTSKTLIDDDPDTFYDTTNHEIYYTADGKEVIHRSEKDGFGHLYLYDLSTGQLKNRMTSGPWVVRDILWVDEAARQVVFTANGREVGQDPYYIHYYRVNFDGTGLIRLTDGDGNHEAVLSPDHQVLVDSWSRVDKAPVHELRRVSDGKLLAKLEEADISSLGQIQYRAPERFVAQGRDGKTDIYGILVRPSKMDPKKSYPVIEDIYAGPQDSFVPKSMRGFYSNQALAELGFIVVRIDGIGTRNRGKAFHDVSFKNLADTGFADRILWMKAAAAKYPYMDISRVGVYGTSAGGQNSTAAVLFHPEFYKVAVSSCGCHDNRMDKVWWNEQWMGLMGPHYAEQSNITNAAKLQGKLLLMVGELDDNVPPESTYRLCDALIKANKEFDFLVLTGARHTNGGPYGERKRRDFFVRNLLGVKTPEWNSSGQRR